jgi:phosphoenolpyruvate---glycerone phosphotransferase subunit DhaL
MGRTALTVAETTAMFGQVAAAVEAGVDVLTQADKAIGDGDHGVGMARGFAAVKAKLAADAPTTLADVVRAVGSAIMSNTGGAAGAIFGTFFRGGSKNLENREVFDAEALALLLNDGLAAVQARGHAQVGDKTMVDALAPAAARASELSSGAVDLAVAAAAAAAREGMEATRKMVAATGKAKTLGERSLGHPDPGAVSVCIILDAMAAYCRE